MRQRGFTLVELVVTLAVFAMILALAAPGVVDWMSNTRIRNVADSLQNGIQIARGEAVRRNQNVSFWLVSMQDPAQLSNDCALSASSGSWVVSVNAPTSHCADAPSTDSSPMIVTGRAVNDAGGNVTVSALQSDASTGATSITFDGFGRATNTDSIRSIDVTGSSSSNINLRIVVSSAGLVRMCDPRVTDANDPRKC